MVSVVFTAILGRRGTDTVAREVPVTSELGKIYPRERFGIYGIRRETNEYILERERATEKYLLDL